MALYSCNVIAQAQTIQVFDSTIALTPNLQAAVLKAPFEISAISLSVKIVDFRKVAVGTTKDSIVTAIIRNTSQSSARVDSIVFVGNDAANFSVLAQTFPFIIDAQSSHTLTLRFKPLTVGLKDSPMRVHAQGERFLGAATGEGVNPVLDLVNPIIDFGLVSIGQWKDTLAVVAVKNVGTSPIEIRRTWHGGPDSLSFSTLQGAGPYTLKPGESARMSLRFQPRFVGRTNGTLIFQHSGPGSPSVLQLYGIGVGLNVGLSDDSAAVGEHRNITLRLLDSLPSQPSAMKFVAHISSPVANYFPSNVNNLQIDENGIQFDVEGDWNGLTHHLGSFDVEAVMASVVSTPLFLESFRWLDSTGNPLPYQSSRKDGSFTLLDLCEAGGKRLVNANGAITMSMVQPNPILNDGASIDIQTSEDSPTLIELVDADGQFVRSFVDAVLQPGTHRISLNFHSIPDGFYILRMRTSTEVRTQSLLLVR